MLIIREQAETKIIQAAEAASRSTQSARTLFIQGSKFRTIKSYDEVKALDFIRRSVNDPKATAYVCMDGDIYIFSPTLSVAFFTTFGSVFSSNFGLGSLQEIGKCFDLTTSLNEVVEACQQKQVILKSKADEKREHDQKAVQAKRAQVLNIPKGLDPVLVGSVSTRRSERKNKSDIEILVVDDDLFTARMVSSVLKPEGKVTVVHDGASALMQYITIAPDILFLDIRLPLVTGHDLLTRIREYDSDAFIVMLSGNSDKENVMHSMKHGAKGFVAKPFTKEKLLQYIDAMKKHRSLELVE